MVSHKHTRDDQSPFPNRNVLIFKATSFALQFTPDNYRLEFTGNRRRWDSLTSENR